MQDNLPGAVLITGIEAWRASSARAEAEDLRAQLDRLAPTATEAGDDSAN